jgi:recombination protein RecT
MGEIAQRNPVQELVAQVRSDDFVGQLELALPETVSARRFARIAVTAIQQNPDLAQCSRDSIAQALLRCAADGLLPDGREAAIVKRGDKASYMPMIAGYRKTIADYGWALRTRVVYEGDEFDFAEEPPEITHRPLLVGDRGSIIAAYAVATHVDGRRLQIVLNAADLAARRAMATTKAVWDKWPGPMSEKSAGRAIYDEIPKGEVDLDRVARLIASERAFEKAEEDPVAALYGRREDSSPAVPPPVDAAAPNLTAAREGPCTGGSNGGQGDGAGEDSSASSGAAAPTAEVEDGDWVEAPAVSEETVEKAAQVKVPGGAFKGKTLAQVAAEEGGEEWLASQLRTLAPDHKYRAAIEVFVEHRLPDLWHAYQAWLAEQTS